MVSFFKSELVRMRSALIFWALYIKYNCRFFPTASLTITQTGLLEPSKPAFRWRAVFRFFLIVSKIYRYKKGNRKTPRYFPKVLPNEWIFTIMTQLYFSVVSSYNRLYHYNFFTNGVFCKGQPLTINNFEPKSTF